MWSRVCKELGRIPKITLRRTDISLRPKVGRADGGWAATEQLTKFTLQ